MLTCQNSLIPRAGESKADMHGGDVEAVTPEGGSHTRSCWAETSADGITCLVKHVAAVHHSRSRRQLSHLDQPPVPKLATYRTPEVAYLNNRHTQLYDQLVLPAQFETKDFGEPRWHERGGYWWFDPAPLPRALSLEPETQLVLSEADMAVGRLSGVGGMLRDPRLLMRPYAVREALASARIEGTQANLTDFFQAEANAALRRGADVDEIAAHVAALERGFELETHLLDMKAVCRVHSILMTHGGEWAEAGRLRNNAVWIGSPTVRPETAVFVPPVGKRISSALRDWEDFIQRPPRLPILIRAAMMYYQLLTIHPFLDGNGRVARVVLLLFLRRERMLSVPLLCISPYFASRRREYYDRLQAVRERGEIQQWLQFVLTAIAAQATDGIARARELLDLRRRYRHELTGSRNRGIDVVDEIFTNPIITSSLIRRKLGVTNQGALNLIRALEDRGWLVEAGTAGRGGASQWLARDVLDIIAGE
jgi:Fic family protein